MKISLLKIDRTIRSERPTDVCKIPTRRGRTLEDWPKRYVIVLSNILTNADNIEPINAINTHDIQEISLNQKKRRLIIEVCGSRVQQKHMAGVRGSRTHPSCTTRNNGVEVRRSHRAPSTPNII